MDTLAGSLTTAACKKRLELAPALSARPRLLLLDERVFTLFPRLKERRRRKASTFFGGEQQMLAIARGLILGLDRARP